MGRGGASAGTGVGLLDSIVVDCGGKYRALYSARSAVDSLNRNQNQVGLEKSLDARPGPTIGMEISNSRRQFILEPQLL